MKLEEYNSNIDNNEIIEIYELTSRLLNDYYMTFGKSDKETYIPIEQIVEWLGLKIVVKDINGYESNSNLFKIASLDREEKMIYISSDIGLSYADKRFAVARMLGVFLLSKSSSNSFRQFSFDIGSNDYAAEIFASFILVPPIDLLKFLNNYYKNNPRMQFNYEKYMNEASGFFKIPFVYMFATFERIRMLFIKMNSNEALEDNKLVALKKELRNNTPKFLF